MTTPRLDWRCWWSAIVDRRDRPWRMRGGCWQRRCVQRLTPIVASVAERDEAGRLLIVRNGYHQVREVLTSAMTLLTGDLVGFRRLWGPIATSEAGPGIRRRCCHPGRRRASGLW